MLHSGRFLITAACFVGLRFSYFIAKKVIRYTAYNWLKICVALTPNNTNIRKCLLLFGAESFVFQVPIQKFKDQDV